MRPGAGGPSVRGLLRVSPEVEPDVLLEAAGLCAGYGGEMNILDGVSLALEARSGWSSAPTERASPRL